MATPQPADPNTNPQIYSPFWFRFFEILPGACVWTALIAPFLLSYTIPLSVTLFIIIFDVYWLITAFNYSYILVKGYFNLQHNMKRDWAGLLKTTLELPADEFQKRQIIDWRELYQVVILATYKEDQSILEASIDSIVTADYPKDHLIFVLATEERDTENARRVSASLQKKYAGAFLRFIATEHPDGIVGEVKAKGANVTWAAKILTEEIHNLGIDPKKVVVSTADADSRFYPSYFLCLSYHYAVLPNRLNCGYQPVTMYFNNLWETPMFSRVMAFGTTFWQIIEGVRDYRLITFATHAMSLKTLIDIDYWCTSIVNEDSRQFFRAFFHYNGKFQVVPLFLPIYMDAVHVGTIRGTIRNLYQQQQRWAYGVEHFPYIVLESLRRPQISIASRVSLIWRAFQGSFSWGTASFFITVVGWIPILLNHQFRDQVAVSNFVVVTKTILSFTWIGIFISGAITLKILPPVPKGKSNLIVLSMIAQWLFIPITSILFSALPGLDAQTHLMLGKYLGFKVTAKANVTPPKPLTLGNESAT